MLMSDYEHKFFEWNDNVTIIKTHLSWRITTKDKQSYQAKCEYCESTEQAMTSQLIARNSLTRSLKAMISVGQTNVLEEKKIQQLWDQDVSEWLLVEKAVVTINIHYTVKRIHI